MGQKVYVGVDQSLRQPGLCVLNERCHVLYLGSLKTDGRGGSRLAEIYRYVVAKVGENNFVVRAAMEGPSLGSEHREFDLGEGSGAVKLALSMVWGCEAAVVEPARLKLFASGRGDTPDLIHAVKKFWGVVTEDDNAADAYALARVAFALENGPGMRRCEMEVIKSMTSPVKPRPKKVRRTDNV